MNTQLLLRWTVMPVVLSCLLVSTSLMRAAEPAQAQDNIYNYLELLRSDLNTAKVDIINRIMKLSAADAEKFWPVYRDYEKALADQSVDRTEFIAEFVKANKDRALGNAKARDMARRWFKMQRVRLDLLEKYHKKIAQSLSSVQAAQFLQIEHQLMLFIDITIASEMPTIANP